MPRRPSLVQKISTDPSPTTVTTTTETVAATVNGVCPDSPDAVVVIEGSVDLSTGANAGSITVSFKVERGTTAGSTQIGNTVTQTIGASSRGSVGFTVKDTPGEGTFSYIITVTQTAATTNGTINQASITASY